MNEPITQSKAWEALQADLGETSYYIKGEDYYYLAILKHAKLANYLYLPYGPVTNSPQGFKNALKSLKDLAIKNNLVFIRIEPQDPQLVQYFPQNTKKSHDLNPKETWILNLEGSDDVLRKKLPSRLLRYYKNAAKNHITVKTSNNPDDIHYLIDLQRALAKEKGINTFSEKYLKTELAQPFATLYLVQYKNPETKREEVIASGLVFDDQNVRYNLQGAQNDQGRRLHATGILTIQLILDAKKAHQKFFDFWGIAPEGAPKNHPWAGFTNFKKTFSGTEIDYAGTYDIVLKPFKYKLYQFFRKLNRFIKK